MKLVVLLLVFTVQWDICRSHWLAVPGSSIR